MHAASIEDNVGIVIPTLNAAADWTDFSRMVLLQGVPVERILVLDSESSDGTATLAMDSGFRVVSIPKNDFSHGGTRNLALDYFRDMRFVVFMTQDAICESSRSIRRLLTAFDDLEVGMAYGRQLPRLGSGPIEAHARLFNYPARSEVRSKARTNGATIKMVFASDSFAAYRLSALQRIGGFPTHVSFGEDTVACARLLLAGYSVSYVSEARVFHSHHLSLVEEGRRYFSIGVLHEQENWLIKEFGSPTATGFRFVISEVGYLSRLQPFTILASIIRTVIKFLAYRSGRWSRKCAGRSRRRTLRPEPYQGSS